MKKKLLLVICLFMLFISSVGAVSSDNYGNAISSANNYIKRFKKYNSYLIIETNTKYSLSSNALQLNSKFTNAGFLNKEEYEVAGGTNSYLDKGIFWSMTESGSTTYVIGKNTYETNTNTYESRVTEYIKPGIEVTGSGTQTNPWKFKEQTKIVITFDNQGATTPGTQSLTLDDGKLTNITSPVRTYYDFEGYYSQKNGGGTKYYNVDGSLATGIETIEEDTTVYAKWKQNTILVTSCAYSANENLSYKIDYVQKIGVTDGSFYYPSNSTLTSFVTRENNNYIKLSNNNTLVTFQLKKGYLTIPGESTVSGSPITLTSRGESYSDYGYIMYHSSGKVLNAGIIYFNSTTNNYFGSLDAIPVSNGEALLFARAFGDSTSTDSVVIPAAYTSNGVQKSVTLNGTNAPEQNIIIRVNSSGKISVADKMTSNSTNGDIQFTSYQRIKTSDGGYIITLFIQLADITQINIPGTLTSTGSTISINVPQNGSPNFFLKLNAAGKIEYIKHIALVSSRPMFSPTVYLMFTQFFSGPNGEFTMVSSIQNPTAPATLTIPSDLTSNGSAIVLDYPYNSNTYHYYLFLTFDSNAKIKGGSIVAAYSNGINGGMVSSPIVAYNAASNQYIALFRRVERGSLEGGFFITSSNTSNGVYYSFNNTAYDNYVITYNRQGKINTAAEFGSSKYAFFDSYYYSQWANSSTANVYNVEYHLKSGSFYIPASLSSDGIAKILSSSKVDSSGGYYEDLATITINSNGKISNAVSYHNTGTSRVDKSVAITDSDGDSHLLISSPTEITMKDAFNNTTEVINAGSSRTYVLIKRNTYGKIVNKFVFSSGNPYLLILGFKKLTNGKHLIFLSGLGYSNIPKEYTRSGLRMILGNNNYSGDTILVLGTDYKLEEVISYNTYSQSESASSTEFLELNDGRLAKVSYSSFVYSLNVCKEATVSGKEIKYTQSVGSGLSEIILSPTK